MFVLLFVYFPGFVFLPDDEYHLHAMAFVCHTMKGLLTYLYYVRSKKWVWMLLEYWNPHS